MTKLHTLISDQHYVCMRVTVFCGFNVGQEIINDNSNL